MVDAVLEGYVPERHIARGLGASHYTTHMVAACDGEDVAGSRDLLDRKVSARMPADKESGEGTAGLGAADGK
jgi:hypothetical protein